VLPTNTVPEPPTGGWGEHMSRSRTHRVLVAAAIVATMAATPASTVHAEPVDLSPIDCLAPAPDAEPGTTEWTVRDRQNVYCSQQRILDRAQHPAGGFAAQPPDPGDARSLLPYDVYTVPERNDGARFRHDAVTVTNRNELPVEVELYRPCAPETCALPESLSPHSGPYPVVIVVPGGALPGDLAPGAPKELYRWAAQGLAEAGYMTLLYDIASAHIEDAEDLLDWALATPPSPTDAGEHNPFWADVDRDRVGIAGHSGGGATALRLGQLDPRIDAIATFDRSGRYDMPVDDAQITKPTLFFVADFNRAQTYDDHPDPDGTGNKVEDFLRLRDLGVDTMHLALRATSHGGWSPGLGERYSALTTLYFTRAWFDRYLKGTADPAIAADAFGRLTAPTFDGSGDEHYVSQGFYDPVKAALAADPYAGNVPYTLAGEPVANLLSFYFRSRCFITTPRGSARATSDDMRATGCSVPTTCGPPATQLPAPPVPTQVHWCR
jgi:hypothetical protein